MVIGVDQTRGVLVPYPTHVLGLIIFMTIILSVKANNASDLGIATDLEKEISPIVNEDGNTKLFGYFGLVLAIEAKMDPV